MSTSVIHLCTCPRCRRPERHPDRELHQQINLLVSRLDEQQRRWFVALEAKRVGRGGETLLARITGLDRRTMLEGRMNSKPAWPGVRPSVSAPLVVGVPRARRRIRSCFRLSKRCSPPRRPAIRWADAPRANAARSVTSAPP